MKQIVVEDNQVIIDSLSFKVDCSPLLEKSIVFVGEDSSGVFVEKEPFNGRIYNVEDVDIDNIFQQAIEIYEENVRPLSEKETLDEAKLRMIEKINEVYSKAVEPLVDEYPDVETKTWPLQEREAKDYLKWVSEGGEQPETPVLANILEGRNGTDGSETLEQLSQAVLKNSTLFIQAQVLTGKRQRVVKAIQNATTKEEAYSIVEAGLEV